MPAQDDINRVLREFRRYTGDGLPGEPLNAPLPVGDPQSGVHNIKKADFRSVLLLPLQETEAARDEAIAARDEAVSVAPSTWQELRDETIAAAEAAADDAGSAASNAASASSSASAAAASQTAAASSANAAADSAANAASYIGAGSEIHYTTRGAASAATIPVQQNRILVGSHTAIGDGGGGYYVSVPDTGDLKLWQFRSNGHTRRWSLQETTVRPEMMGAVGAARDTAKDYLQACVDYLATIGGGDIFLPAAHTYKTQGASLDIINTNHIRMYGGGLIHRTDNPASGQNVIVVNNSDYVSLVGIRVAGDPAIARKGDAGFGVVVENSDQFELRRCELFNLPGMGVIVSNGLSPVIENNSVHHCKSDGIHFSDGVRYGIIDANLVFACGDDMISVTDDFVGTGNRPYGNVVTNNRCAGNFWGAGIRVTNSDRTIVSSNVVEETSSNGIALALWTSDPAAELTIVSGNIVRRTGRVWSADAGQNPEGHGRGASYVHGIQLQRGSNVLIEGNIIDDVNVDVGNGTTRATAISMQEAADDVVIKNNVIRNAARGIGTHDTLEFAGTAIANIVVDGNVIQGTFYEGMWFQPPDISITNLTITNNRVSDTQLTGAGPNAIYVAKTGGSLLTIDGNITPGKAQAFDRATCSQVRSSVPVDWSNQLSFGFSTPGNQNFTYTARTARYTVRGRKVRLDFFMSATVTHTTASGALLITGLPIVAATVADVIASWSGSFSRFSGITKAGYTQFAPNIGEGQTFITVTANGQGQAVANVGSGDVPTGGTLAFHGSIEYEIDA